MSTSVKRYRNVDWERVVKVLRVKAVQLYGTERKIIDATAADDLVNDVIYEFLTHPTGMGWNSKKGKLEYFLLTVLKRRWIDRYRREKKISGSFDDEKFTSEPQAEVKDPLEMHEYESLVKVIKERVKDKPKLVELIEAVELIDSSHNVNQQMADLIGTSVRDIENRKRQLRRAALDVYHEYRRSQQPETKEAR